MKEYPLTQPELIGIGGMSLAATVFFSLASWCGTTWFDLLKDIAMDDKMDAATKAYWKGLQTAFGFGAIGLSILGVIFLLLNGLALLNIIRSTRHV